MELSSPVGVASSSSMAFPDPVSAACDGEGLTPGRRSDDRRRRDAEDSKLEVTEANSLREAESLAGSGIGGGGGGGGGGGKVVVLALLFDARIRSISREVPLALPKPVERAEGQLDSWSGGGVGAAGE